MTRKRNPAFGVLITALLLIPALAAGCQPSAPATPQAITLTVSAASDLTYAFQEIGQRFQAETGHQVVFNFSSSGQLAQQIEQGAPVDIFAAADASFIDEIEKAGLILPDTRQIYGQGRIIVWTRADSPLTLARLEDLARPEVRRLAIANPDHAPYGRAARDALQAAGVWEDVQPRLVLGENVRQALQYAETGNVDAAIVALSLVVPGTGAEQGRQTLIPADLHHPLDQTLAVIKTTPHEAAARAFAAFIAGPQGREIMARYGFSLPAEGTGP